VAYAASLYNTKSASCVLLVLPSPELGRSGFEALLTDTSDLLCTLDITLREQSNIVTTIIAASRGLLHLVSIMRLLEYNKEGEFSLTGDYVVDIPRYAILSHTWEGEEVTFGDLMDGTGKSKAGYDKIQFCGEQAKRDGLQYFWVDTCCIDKSNNTELSEAINSMFRWYRDAAKCYIYLSDIPRTTVNSTDRSTPLPWESAFRKSRWFTRSWTLQELIAPTSVEFFSKDREWLGDKKSLERRTCEITGIPAEALQRAPLSQFSVNERLSWAENRQTTCKEDKAYSLLIYGEGAESAFKRLREKIDISLEGERKTSV
jgi:hypothetical protein